MAIWPSRRASGAPDAVMDAHSECQVPVWLSGQVEIVRIDELPLVPICRRDPGKDQLATRNRHTGRRDVLACESLRRRRDRAIVAQ